MTIHPAATLTGRGRSAAFGAAAAAAGIAVLLAVAGCASSKAKPPATTLAPQDFQRPPAPAAPAEHAEHPEHAEAPAPAQPTPPPVTAAPRPLKPIRMIAVSEAMEGVLDVSTIPGPPPEAARQELPPRSAAAAIVLDSKVGEINGRPIFASAFLEPLDGRLRAAALEARGDMGKWQRSATQVIRDALQREIWDELLLAEAHASMPREHKEIGLRAFMQQFQEEMARRNQGSIAAADERLRREEGLSLDEKTRQELDKQLIHAHLVQRVTPRIHISTRDQRDFYERNFDRFNPPGDATLRLIRVPASNEDGIAAVRAALESGVPFAEAASLDANTFNRTGGGVYTVKIQGPQEEAEFITIGPVNDAARTLREGDHAGPIEVDGAVWWVMLERVDRPETKSFYEAQLEISRLLSNQRSHLEEQRYINQLLDKGSYTDLEEMGQRLLDIATARYFGRM
jgi:hypothetical protein